MHNCSIFVGSLARHCGKRAERLNKKCLKISTASLEPKMLLAVGAAEMRADLCHTYTNATPTTIKYNGKRPRPHIYIQLCGKATKRRRAQSKAKRNEDEAKKKTNNATKTTRSETTMSTHTYIYICIAMWKSQETKTSTKRGEAKRGRSEGDSEKRYEDEWAVLN